MAEFRFEAEIRGLERLRRQPARFTRAFESAGRELMAEALGLLHRKVTTKTPVNTGQLRSSIGFSSSRLAGNDIEGRIGTNLGYAIPVERGSRPHWPPLEPIEFWVRRKLRPPRKQIRSVAFLVARKISRRGTKAHRMFEQGLEETRPRISRIFQRLPQAIKRKFDAVA